MNIYNNLKGKLELLINEVSGQSNINYSNVVVEPPRNPEHGDLAINAAMVLAKQLSQNPRELAEKIAAKLKELDEIADVSIAGPGFINIKMIPEFWQNCVADILKSGTQYGASDIDKGHKINIEFVSANPTGPMHIGHARGGVYGDVLSRLMAHCGYEVTKEFYTNDAGGQIKTLVDSAYLRYREALGEDIGAIPNGLYPGDYLVPVGQKLKDKFSDELLAMDDETKFANVRLVVLEDMMNLIKDDLKKLGIEFDIFFSEASLHEQGKLSKVVDLLQKQGHLYRGVLEPPKGEKPDDWEEREQLLFKTTDFGDDVDRPLQKSDDSWTYFASDLAYTQDKIKRSYDSLCIILGADHGGYVKRIKAAASALSDGKVDMDIKLTQLVNLYKNGEPLKMSKRAGTFVTVSDVVDAVGKDIIRFVMLTRKNDAVLDFDLEKVKEQSKDNPVFYVQYAHARASSVLKNAAKEMSDMPDILDHLDLLKEKEEIDLVKTLCQWTKVVESAALHHEPHRIAFYLQDLAAAFHSFWALGREKKYLKFIIADNKELTSAHLALVEAVKVIIKAGLSIFNVEPVDNM